MERRLEQAEHWDGLRRLNDLRDQTCSHDWLYALNPAHGVTLAPEDFLEAVRIRLGAPLMHEPCICASCGEAVLDTFGSHALRCAKAACTVGHNRVRDAVHQLAHAADASATTEPEGLIPYAPGLRPADILTSAALPGSLAALDIGICSPDSAGAGADCCASMATRKLRSYQNHFGALGRQGIRYQPMPFSSYGRMHPSTAAILITMARGAARRQGVQGHKPILRRAQARIGAEIWKRAAAMVRACRPALSKETLAILLGDDPCNTHPGDTQDQEDQGKGGAATAAAAAAGNGIVGGGGTALWA